MGRAIVTGDVMKRNIGFTLVELMLVLFVVALLASIAAPVLTQTIRQARETTLKENLYVMRKAIDDYRADTGRYPDSLSILTEKRYIRKVPVDPLTERADTWVEIHSEEQLSGILDVRSGSEDKSYDGTAYSEW